MPLFFWTLDTTIINSYRIYKAQSNTITPSETTEQHAPPHKKNICHQKRQELPVLDFSTRDNTNQTRVNILAQIVSSGTTTPLHWRTGTMIRMNSEHI